MAKRGKRADSRSAQVLGGTRQSRVRLEPPAVSSGRPVPPGHLSPEGLSEWSRAADLLAALRVLTVGDGPLLDAYADAWECSRLARRELEKHGLVIETDLGGVKANPAATTDAKARDQMIRCLIEMGLTPAARSRVAANAEPERDTMAEFLERRNAQRPQ